MAISDLGVPFLRSFNICGAVKIGEARSIGRYLAANATGFFTQVQSKPVSKQDQV